MNRTLILAIGLAGALAATAAMAQSKPDKESQSFIKTAIEANYAEIDVGKLAQEKGTTQAIKNFGKMLVEDHSANNEKAKAVAQKLNVSPPSGASTMEKATYLKLKVLSGKSFDSAFAKAMVSDHQSNIKEFQKQAGKGDAAASYAKDTLPALQKHLSEAQSLQQQTTGSK